MKVRILTAATALVASALLLPVASASAATDPYKIDPPKTLCGGTSQPYDSFGHTHTPLSVYTSAGGGSKVGTVPAGNWFCYHSSSGKLIGNTYWVQGFGYNTLIDKGAKVVGWVNDYYIAG